MPSGRTDIPRDAAQVLKINPDSDTTSTFGDLPGTNKWNAGVVASNRDDSRPLVFPSPGHV